MNFFKRLFNRNKTVKAWHFLKPDKRLNYKDGRLVELNVPLRITRTPDLCVSGLHASLKALDAYKYCSWGDPIACRVLLRGKKMYGTDKLCAEERTVIGWCKTTDILHELACRIAEDLLEQYYKKDKIPKDIIDAVKIAISVKRSWIENKHNINQKCISGKLRYRVHKEAPDLLTIVNSVLSTSANESLDGMLSICRCVVEWKKLKKYNIWFERMLTGAMLHEINKLNK